MPHAEQHAHDKDSPNQPFPKTAANARFPMRSRPAVDKMSHLLDSEQPKAAVLSYCLASSILPDRLIGLLKCGIAVHNWVAGEMAKHKPYKFACSTLRLEGPALRKCNTQKRKAVEQRRTDQVKTLKANNRELIESWIGGKQNRHCKG